MNIVWFFPTSGDGRYLGTTRGARPITPTSPLLGKARPDDGASLKGVVMADRQLPDVVDIPAVRP
jgi:hypothetical protein